MIYTSYYANFRKFPKDYKVVSVSQYVPSWFKEPCKHYIGLAPTKELLFNYKGEDINEEEYIKIFKEDILSKLNVHRVYEELNGSILLCYEKRGEFCHRNIISEWFRENGYESEELILY